MTPQQRAQAQFEEEFIREIHFLQECGVEYDRAVNYLISTRMEYFQTLVEAELLKESTTNTES